MGKYEPLARYLNTHPGDVWNATFEEVEEKLGFAVPPSAHEYREWWANQKKGNRSQAKGWLDAGWETCEVDLQRRFVRFERKRPRGSGNARGSTLSPPKKPDLWGKARELTGLEDRETLIDAALTALIRQEISKYFSQIGGSTPDFDVPPRERPFA